MGKGDPAGGARFLRCPPSRTEPPPTWLYSAASSEQCIARETNGNEPTLRSRKMPSPPRLASRLALLSGVAVLSTFAASCGTPRPDARASDPLAGNEPRVEELLAQMTLAEKVGQMTQADQEFLQDPADIERYFLGSLLRGGTSDPREGNTLQAWSDLDERYQQHAQPTRLKIPLLYGIEAV